MKRKDIRLLLMFDDKDFIFDLAKYIALASRLRERTIYVERDENHAE